MSPRVALFALFAALTLPACDSGVEAAEIDGVWLDDSGTYYLIEVPSSEFFRPVTREGETCWRTGADVLRPRDAGGYFVDENNFLIVIDGLLYQAEEHEGTADIFLDRPFRRSPLTREDILPLYPFCP